MAYPTYNQAQAIVTTDGTNTTGKWKALYCGSAGTVKVDMSGPGADGITLTAVAGGLLPVSVTKVYGTGSSITNGNLFGLN